MPGGIFGCHWQVVGRDQGCYLTSCKCIEQPSQQRIDQPQMSVGTSVEKLWSIHVNCHGASHGKNLNFIPFSLFLAENAQGMPSASLTICSLLGRLPTPIPPTPQLLSCLPTTGTQANEDTLPLIHLLIFDFCTGPRMETFPLKVHTHIFGFERKEVISEWKKIFFWLSWITQFQRGS